MLLFTNFWSEPAQFLLNKQSPKQIEANMRRLLIFILLRCHCLCLLAFFTSPATASAPPLLILTLISPQHPSAPSTSPSRPHFLSPLPLSACSDITFTHSSSFHPTPPSHIYFSSIAHLLLLWFKNHWWWSCDHIYIYINIYIYIYVFCLRNP